MHIDTGPGLEIQDSHVIEMESDADLARSEGNHVQGDGAQEGSLSLEKKFDHLNLVGGKIEFPDWASDISSILWVPIRAIRDKLSQASSTG